MPARRARRPLRPDIPEISASVATYNNILTAHARLRVQSREGRYRPYVDGVSGVRDIYTRSVLDLKEDLDNEYAASTTNLRDVGLSYGGGAGITIGIGTPTKPALLDISVRFVSGSSSNYLVPGAIRRDGDQLSLDLSRSRATMLLFYIGVAVPAR